MPGRWFSPHSLGESCTGYPLALARSQYWIAVALAPVVYYWIERQGAMAGTQDDREG